MKQLIKLQVAVCLCIWAAYYPTPTQAQPNILVILTDDLGRGDYSAFGTKYLRTPHMDRLFQEGMTFQNFFANSCVCSPTRAALLTGCYPDRVGVPGVIRENPRMSWGYLAPEATLLPQLLKPAGYHSAIIGKWHLGESSPNTPTERGFDFFHGFLGDMMDYWTHERNGQNFMRRNLDTVSPQGHATDVFTDWACDYIKDRSKETDKPFYLYLAYTAPHSPIQPPPDWVRVVKQREPGLSATQVQYVALIEHLDAGIGKLLATLDQTGLSTNTLVIFTSDNGGVLGAGANNGPWRDGKCHVYEGGLRVPGAVRWPGVVAPGSRTDRVTLTMDIFATACDVAGVKSPANIDGVSFLPVLRGQTPVEPPRDLYFVWRDSILDHGGKTCEALRRGDWKLLQDDPFEPLRLYNLKADPQEKFDRAKTETKIFRELAGVLRKQIQRGGCVPWQPPANDRKPGTKAESD